MPGEEDQVELGLTAEEEAAADAEFEAAFNAVRNEGTLSDADAAPATDADQTNADDTMTAADPAPAEPDAAAQAEAAAQAQADAEANAPVTLTKAELDVLRSTAARVTELQEELKTSNQKAFGHIGSIRQTIDAIKAQAQQGVRPSMKQLKRLEGEFPELAKLLSEDLEEAFGSSTPAAPEANASPAADAKASGEVSPGAAADADPLADPRVQQVLKSKEMAIVDVVHPDWRNLAQTAEFNEWKSSLPAPAQQLLATTWQSDVMIDAFKDFKGWKQKRDDAARASRERGKRLENGIPATTGTPTGANVIDDDAAFLAGFNKARGQK